MQDAITDLGGDRREGRRASPLIVRDRDGFERRRDGTRENDDERASRFSPSPRG
jgi:hypothetical protein